MSEKWTDYEPTGYLTSKEAIALFISKAFATNDASYIAHALGVVVRAKGMPRVAKQTGFSLEQLYRSLSKGGNPTLEMTLAVLSALGIELVARVHSPVHVIDC